MVDIIHKIGINAPLSKVYAAVSSVEGIAGWWTRETSGDAKLGGTVSVLFRSPNGDEKGRMGFELVKLVPGERVVWRFSSGPQEWLGTEVTFELLRREDMTIVVFGHRQWSEAKEFMAHCSMKWATFLLSLRQLLETGEGRPAPIDLKIDDWN
jgi:uncharacterized protein YndB with AHSA1/START domain